MTPAERREYVARSRARAERLSRRARAALQPSAVGYSRALKSWTREVCATVRRSLLPHTDAVTPIEQVQLLGRVGDLRVELSERKIGGWLNSAAKTTTEHAQKETARILQVKPSADLDPLIDVWRRENVALIRSIPEELLDDVDDLISDPTIPDLAEALAERFEISENRADFIALDQTLKLNGQVQRAEQEAAGCESYIWITSKDERVRESHQALDDQQFNWGDPPVVDEKTGRTAEPGQDFRCRCTAYPILPS